VLSQPPSFARRAALAIPVAAGVALACLRAATAQSLEDALSQAYLYNPQLATERQRLREQDEGVPRALSGWRPRVVIGNSIGKSVIHDNLSRDRPQNRTPQDLRLTVTQPLYTGGRVGAQVQQAEALVLAQRATLRATEASVLAAAATAYLDVARDQRIVQLNRGNVRLLERTAAAARQQAAAGAVTRADAAQALARLADGRATLAAAEAALANSRAAYQRQVGTLPGSLDMPQRRLPLPPSEGATVGLAVERNFDVAAARQTQAAAQSGIDVARAGLLPQVSLQASLARVKDTDVQLPGQRDNIAEGAIVFSVPLYQGGETAAETRQAHEAAERTRLQVDVALRQARQQALTAWNDLAAARTRAAERRTSVAANEVALRGVTRQQEVGARTLLDVLNAQLELLNANVGLVSAQHDEQAAGFALLAATGGLTAEGLVLPVPIYDPARHYRETRDRWGGTRPAP